MIIALVRHGETEWNRQRRWQGRQGVGLNDLGRRQASAAAPLLRGVDWSWMITSPLERTVETARIIADELAAAAPSDLSLEEDDGVIERAYGAAEGVLAAEAARRWPDGRFPGMETDSELADRGAAALRRIAAARSGNGIVVSHGSFIRATINALTGVDAPRILNGSVSLARTDGAIWEVVDVNRVTDVAGAGLVEHSGG
jgi:broad specificity phosphatase PhoE